MTTIERTTIGAHGRRGRAMLLGLAMVTLPLIPSPALALDYQLCGVGNTPPTTGWNGHTDTKTRTVTLGCGQVETFTVDFYAELTFADKQLGAIEWVLADGNPGNNDLLTTLLDCPQILALPVGTDFIGFAEFRLKCTPGCIVEGVDIIAIDLMTWPDLQTRCRIAFPPAIVGDSGGQGAILSLRDDTGFHERMCNTMKIRCSQFGGSMSISPPSLPHGTDGTFLISSPEGAFTDSSDVTWGVDGDIQVVSTTVLDPFTIESTVSVPLSVTPGPLTLLVNNVNDIPSSLLFTIDPLRWANVDAGLGTLTITDQGRLGWLDAEHTMGDGLSFSIRPWMPNCTWPECTEFGGAASLWSSNGPEHVANRDYSDAPGDADWLSTGDPVAFVERVGYDQAVVSSFVDAGPLSTGLAVEQEALGLSTAFGGQVLFLEYRLTNTGLPIEANHTGVFLDVDMHGDGSNDLGVADPETHIVYMRDAEFDGIVALICTKPYDWPRLPAPGTMDARGTPPGVATLVDIDAHVLPGGTMSDADRFGYLSADPAYVLTDATVPGNYGMLMGTGPAPFLPGEQRDIALAIIVARSVSDVVALADAARYYYSTGGLVDVPGGVVGGLTPRPRLVLSPNPTRAETIIRLDVGRAAVDALDVFDAQGRLVRDLLSGGVASLRDGASRVVWDGADARGRSVPAGVYFVRLRSGEATRTERVSVIR